MGTSRAAGSALSQALKDLTAQPAANAAQVTIAPQPVRVLTLNLGAERVQRANEAIKSDELWHGSAFSANDDDGGDHDIPVYVRLASPQPVVAELVCAVIGRALGLPVPEPFLIGVLPGSLTGSKFLADSPDITLAFASHDVGAGSFAQLLRSDSAHAEALLRRWEHLVPVAVFDEWLANPDRNPGNLLFMANTLWLIDHADALGGSARQLFDLAELQAESFRNLIGELLNKGCSAAERAEHLATSQAWLRQPASQLSLPDALACAGVSRWLTAAEESELLDFISTRLTLAHSLLCSRLGSPQLLPKKAPAAGSAAPASAPSSSSRPS